MIYESTILFEIVDGGASARITDLTDRVRKNGLASVIKNLQKNKKKANRELRSRTKKEKSISRAKATDA